MAAPTNLQIPVAPKTSSAQYTDLALWLPTYGVSGTSLSAVVGSLTATAGGDATVASDADMGAAMVFDGSGDYFEGNAAISLATNQSVSFWFKAAAWVGERNIVGSMSADASNGWQFYHYNNYTYFMIRNSGSTSYAEYIASANSNWHHVCLSRTVSGTLNIYYDKTLAYAAGGTESVSSGENFLFGKYATGANYFNGRIADFRIYNRLLDGDEVEELADNPWDLYALARDPFDWPTGYANNFGPFDPKDLWARRGIAPRRFWSFAWQPTGQTVTTIPEKVQAGAPSTNQSATASPFALTAAGSPQSADMGFMRSGVSLNGTSQYLEGTSLAVRKNWSFGVWFTNTDSDANESRTLVQCMDGGSNNGFAIMKDNGHLTFVYKYQLTKSGQTQTISLTKDWTGATYNDSQPHLAFVTREFRMATTASIGGVTFNLYNSTFKLYIDYDEVDTVVSEADFASGLVPAANGSLLFGYGGYGYWKGIIGDAYAFDKALTANEVKSFYDRPEQSYQPGNLGRGTVAVNDGSGWLVTKGGRLRRSVL